MPESGEASEVAIVREGLEVLANEGPNALLDRYTDFFTEDFEWRPVLTGSVEGERTFVGKKPFALYWRELTSAFGRPAFGELSYASIGASALSFLSRRQAEEFLAHA